MSKISTLSALYLDTDPNWSNETLSLTLALSYLDLKSFERDMLNNFEHVEDRIYCIGLSVLFRKDNHYYSLHAIV